MLKIPLLSPEQRRMKRLNLLDPIVDPFAHNRNLSAGFAADHEGSVYQKSYHFRRIDERDKASGSQI